MILTIIALAQSEFMKLILKNLSTLQNVSRQKNKIIVYKAYQIWNSILHHFSFKNYSAFELWALCPTGWSETSFWSSFVWWDRSLLKVLLIILFVFQIKLHLVTIRILQVWISIMNPISTGYLTSETLCQTKLSFINNCGIWFLVTLVLMSKTKPS